MLIPERSHPSNRDYAAPIENPSVYSPFPFRIRSSSFEAQSIAGLGDRNCGSESLPGSDPEVQLERESGTCTPGFTRKHVLAS